VTTLGWFGVALLIASAVGIVIEGVVAGLWARRISARARELSHRMEAERGLIEADVARLRRAFEETKVLWQPYHRALRFLRHPLTVALIQSLLRRRKAARARP
jgi:hypothetical protein